MSVYSCMESWASARALSMSLVVSMLPRVVPVDSPVCRSYSWMLLIIPWMSSGRNLLAYVSMQ